jgi:starch-binding outer membrane protein, SusD/RagB family
MPSFSMPESSGARLRWGVPLALLALTAGCSELTSVDSLDVVTMTDLETRQGAQVLRAGAIDRFKLAVAGTFFNLIPVVSNFTDESTSTTVAGEALDQRNAPDPGGTAFAPLATARGALVQAADYMTRFDPTSTARLSELYALLGYTEQFFAEVFCSGVPLSHVKDGAPVYGEQLTTLEMLKLAEAHFDTAVAAAGTLGDAASVRSRNLARVGRGRALLHQGRFAEAASAVADVPSDFVYRLEYTAQMNNFGWRWFRGNRQWTIANREGGNGLDFASSGDPRIGVVRTNLIGLDRVTPVFAPDGVYPTSTSPVTLASGVEVRLIEAEALLRGGNASGALSKLNELRTRVPGLAPLPLEATEAGRVDQLFRERAFWLFLTGHRLGDLRRLIRQYGRDSESVFPTGPYRGGQYERFVNIGLPGTEVYNPLFTGTCFNRDP